VKNPGSLSPCQGQANSSQRILVVDDQIEVRELMVTTLSHLGYEKVDTARDGADAWVALRKMRYCLVITDHKMPKLTGLELIARMRSEGMSQPVILMSGTMPTHELIRSPGLRVDALLSKPFTVAELEAAIKRLLGTTDSPIIAKQDQLSRAEEPATALTRGQKDPPRILVVDDGHDSRKLQIDLLTSSGYHVEAANDGAAGWEALRSHNYDLVITDNHMPRMTGLDMIERLHLSRMTIPVIMVTGRPPTEEVALKPWLKPKAMLEKPFVNRELLEMVSNILGHDGKEDHQGTPLPESL
jgi:DNA-binding response OmpR family regulator